MSERQPLAAAIRPQALEEFVGQDHLRTRLQALFLAKRLPGLLFFGPPGCGKSTLALLLAKSRNQPFLRLSAPEVGLANLRKKLEKVTILVLDELHRFSKAQQDFFLPLLESGEITLLATTSENPSFSVTKQLLSRMHVLRLRPLSRHELLTLARRGTGSLQAAIPDSSLDLLVGLSNGDARTMFNLLELTAELPKDKWSEDKLRQALPEVMLRGDREGDTHYELASALIKSIRGSDPNAALYYLACLLEGGEDPCFVCRRLILSASEDVGLADPQALPLAVACQQAVEFVGMPEGFIPLAETVVYLALAPKSNSTYAAYLAAQKEVRALGANPVPLHLRNASTVLQKEWGYGRGYKYPHAFPEAWVEQDYLPSEVRRRFYEPKLQGQEPRLNAWLTKHRKALRKPS